MKDIIERLVKFRDDRNWKQFHTPENLSKSVILEAAELLENYQWGEGHEDIDNVKDEIADILSYCFLICEHYKFDIKEILNNKITKNEKKYPIDKAYGKSNKYNNL